jgi:hypothetical protein
MEETLRERLVERRRLAQRRGERQDYSASFRAVLPGLRSEGLRFSRLSPVASRRLLEPFASTPGEDEEFIFDGMPAATTHGWSSDTERDGLCQTALMELGPAGTTVAVIWHPYTSGLRIRVADLLSHITPVLNAGNGGATWIVPVSGEGWLIQVGFWSRTVSWVPAASEPVQRTRTPQPGCVR